MAKVNSRYFSMFTIAIISLGLFNAGCSNQSKRNDTLEKQMDTLSRSVGSLGPEINELKKNLSKQKSDIETTLSLESNAHNRLEQGLSATENILEEIKRNLALVEEDKGKMKTRLDALETLSKTTIAETSLYEDLLDEAIKLYQQGQFKDAVSKWEEVLARDPGQLQAKFNIEIAKDRIKQNEIHEELKELLIQRK
jgi:tetratricopeptide (TPR) repeat protein